MINTGARAPAAALALLFAMVGGVSAATANEFTDACAKAEIFSADDCTCLDGKATAADERSDIMAAFVTGDPGKKDASVDEAKVTRGMTAIGKYGPECDKPN